MSSVGWLAGWSVRYTAKWIELLLGTLAVGRRGKSQIISFKKMI